MIAFLHLLTSPFTKYILIGLAVVALLFGANRWVHSVLEGAREEVRQEYQVKALEQAVKDAEADKAFALDQAAKAEQASAELRSDLSSMASKVKASSTVIHDRVASGELTNTRSSDTVMATIDQIELLEKSRQK